jgi:hypothetical protein
VGSRSKIDLAYIAGFLDGDGSLMLQIKKRQEGKSKLRFMATICFYQDTRHENELKWIRKILGIGYLSRRKDGMSELRINGFKQIKEILKNLIPFIRFKKHQAQALLEAVIILESKTFQNLLQPDLKQIVKHISTIQTHNYVTKHKRSEAELYQLLGLTP